MYSDCQIFPRCWQGLLDSRPEWGRIYLSLWLPMSCDMYEQLCGWETLKNFSLASVCCSSLKARCSGCYRRDNGKPAWLTLVNQRIIYTSTKNPGLWFVTDTNSNWTGQSQGRHVQKWGCQGLFSIWWLIFFHPTWSGQIDNSSWCRYSWPIVWRAWTSLFTLHAVYKQHATGQIVFLHPSNTCNFQLAPTWHFHLRLGARQVVAYLIQHGADVDAADANGKTSLYIACQWLGIISQTRTSGTLRWH
jgi:hypothetical protein